MKGLYNTASSRNHNMKKDSLSLCKSYSQKGTFVFISIHTVFKKNKFCTA